MRATLGPSPRFARYHAHMVMLLLFLAAFGYFAWADHGRGVRPLTRVDVPPETLR